MTRYSYGPRPMVATAESRALYAKIQHGSSVTILTPHGNKISGRAVMLGDYGWVLNMGGQHGTPGMADDCNVVAVRAPRGEKAPKLDFRTRSNPSSCAPIRANPSAPYWKRRLDTAYIGTTVRLPIGFEAFVQHAMNAEGRVTYAVIIPAKECASEASIRRIVDQISALFSPLVKSASITVLRPGTHALSREHLGAGLMFVQTQQTRRPRANPSSSAHRTKMGVCACTKPATKIVNDVGYCREHAPDVQEALGRPGTPIVRKSNGETGVTGSTYWEGKWMTYIPPARVVMARMGERPVLVALPVDDVLVVRKPKAAR